MGLILAGIVAVITQAIAGDFSSAAGDIAGELREAGPFWALLVFAIMVMVGAPIVEELAFRGMLYNSLRKRGVGAVWTIAITTVAFSAFHFERSDSSSFCLLESSTDGCGGRRGL